MLFVWFIFRILLEWSTFPGVILHEWAHAAFCTLTKTRIHKVCFFQMGLPMGYVEHGRPPNLGAHFLVGVGPLFVNTSTAFVLSTWLAFQGVTWERLTVSQIFAGWGAISFAMHAFPSQEDARNVWNAVWRGNHSFFMQVIGIPLAGLMFLISFSTFFFSDVAYAGLVLVVPSLIVKATY